MENEVRLIECRSCDSKNCNGCNVFTLANMLHNGDFDCLMDEHKSIAFTPESLRPKGRWEYYSSTMQECSVCKRHTARHKYEYCPRCGRKMEG